MSQGKGYSANMDRQDRLIKERIHDPYMNRSKPTEPTICPQCKVIFSDGRWQWQPEVTKTDNEELVRPVNGFRTKYRQGF